MVTYYSPRGVLRCSTRKRLPQGAGFVKDGDMSSFSFNLEPTVDLARQPCEARVTRHSRTLEYQPLRLEFLKELPKFVDTVIGDSEEKLREYLKQITRV